jgi:hypothetical protein
MEFDQTEMNFLEQAFLIIDTLENENDSAFFINPNGNPQVVTGEKMAEFLYSLFAIM